jgi:hypothetical protein
MGSKFWGVEDGTGPKLQYIFITCIYDQPWMDRGIVFVLWEWAACVDQSMVWHDSIQEQATRRYPLLEEFTSRIRHLLGMSYNTIYFDKGWG